MQNLKLRRYKSEDKDIVWQLHEVGLAVINTKPTPGSSWDKDVEDVKGNYFPDGEFLIAEVEGKVVGMGGFQKKAESEVEIKRMRVLPEFQRKGIGQEILNALEKRAEEMGYIRVTLYADDINKNAINFYLKNGYKPFKKAILNLRNISFNVIYYEKAL